MLLPVACLCCKQRGAWNDNICPACFAELPWLDSNYCCRRCAAPSTQALCGQCALTPPYFDEAICALGYDFTAKMILTDFKFAGKRACSKALACALAYAVRERAQSLSGSTRVRTLVPVPLATSRRRQRGFNQSELLARDLGSKLGLRVNPSALQRSQFVAAQSSLTSTRERQLNVRGAFRLGSLGDILKGDEIIIIDDVLTSGATANAISRVFRDSGYTGKLSVWCVIRATPRHRD